MIRVMVIPSIAFRVSFGALTKSTTFVDPTIDSLDSNLVRDGHGRRPVPGHRRSSQVSPAIASRSPLAFTLVVDICPWFHFSARHREPIEPTRRLGRLLRAGHATLAVLLTDCQIVDSL